MALSIRISSIDALPPHTLGSRLRRIAASFGGALPGTGAEVVSGLAVVFAPVGCGDPGDVGVPIPGSEAPDGAGGCLIGPPPCCGTGCGRCGSCAVSAW